MKKFISALTTLLCCLCFAATALANEVEIINVHTVQELVSAMKPDTVINLAPGTYNITEASDISTRYISWENTFDGPQLNLNGIKNLTIMGGTSAGDYHLVVSPSYADVIQFFNCDNIRITGVKMGHLKTGGCVGSVLHFITSKGIELSNCDLYGCGVIGLELESVNNIKVSRSYIHDCSSELLFMENCNQVVFDHTTFKAGKESGWTPTIVINGPATDVSFTDSIFCGYESMSIFYGQKTMLYNFNIQNCCTRLLDKQNNVVAEEQFSFQAAPNGSPNGLFGYDYAQNYCANN